MAKEDHGVHSRITELNRCIEAVDGRVQELIMLKDSLKNGDEVEVLRDRIQEVKKQQEDVKKRFNETIGEFSRRIHSFMKEEDAMKETLNELMLQFGKEGWCSFIFGDLKIQEDYMTIAEESDEEWESLKAIKDGAAELEAQFSRLLFDFMVELSKNDDKMLAKFRNFRSSLLVLAEGGKTIAINRTINALERADKKVKTMKTVMLLESLEGSSASIKETALHDSEPKERSVEWSQLDQLLEKIRNEILHLEIILKYPSLPESKILKKRELSSLKALLKQCEQDMKEIEMEVSKINI